MIVRPTTLLEIDPSGRVISATTNTGCAPDADDMVYVISPDGSVTEATDRDLTDREWSGDFAVPGVFQPQP